MTWKAISIVHSKPRRSCCRPTIITGSFRGIHVGQSGRHGACQVYITGLAGNYQLLFSTTLRADTGPWGSPPDAVLYYVAGAGEQVPAGTSSQFENYRSQVRHLRSAEFIVHESDDKTACTEIQRLDGVDKSDSTTDPTGRAG
jgi:hypothetical protein